ncbi:MAG: NusG domain II-containing protein [Clostridia bacterium]|nr:NusG domain II-containing protein [Clostridia bacterium]
MQKKIFGNKKMIADIILIAAVLVIALSVFLIVELSRKEGAFVRVSVNGERVAEYSLSVDGEYSLNGGTNILVIENGEAYIKWADCPRQICVKDGKISRTGERITCLENRVVVEVFGKGDEILEV